MRRFKTVAQIKEEHPAVKAWILEPPGGARILLKPTDPEPEGRYCLVGTLEK